VRSAPAGWGFALKIILNWLGAGVAAASLLSGCIDPGPSRATAATASSGSRSATLSWDAPTSNTNGSPLMDLGGYRIYYGSTPGELTQTIQISSIGMQTYVIDGLEPGTWYFAIVAVARNGIESSLSNIAVKTIS
jgi:Fibronectin type III domain